MGGLRKLPGFLATIQASRIKNPEIQEKVHVFQGECDDALWSYWSQGEASLMPAREGIQDVTSGFSWFQKNLVYPLVQYVLSVYY